ncbi:MAG: ABC transporter permease [Nitrospirota bacterium]|nr:ABC transporter permease [Nitrospirota bacterium]
MAENFFGSVGRRALSFRRGIHEASVLVNNTFYWTFVSPFKGMPLRIPLTVSEMVKTGYNSIPIVAVISFFVGIILAFQAAYQLKKVGALIYVANLVGVSLTRELSPILTAIIVAGRSGSYFAAEIGSMKVSEEVDALTCMGINPVGFLVSPKLVAMMIMLPALTLFSDLIGIAGGLLLSSTVLGINWFNYYQQTLNALLVMDVISGLVKALAFAVIITLVGAYQGFRVEGGAEEVGKRTTSSVVTSIFLVIVFDLFFTVLFYYFT